MQRGIDQRLGDLLLVISALEIGALRECLFERHLGIERNHLREPVALAIAQAHDATNIADDAFRFQFAEGDDLRNAASTVFLPDVFEDLAAARFAEIDVDIGRRNTFRVEETLELQTELERIDVGNFEDVSDERTGRRTAARTNWNAVLFGEMNEVPDDQEIADEAGFLEHREFLIESGAQLGIRRGSIAKAFTHAGVTKFPQILTARLARGRFVFGKF